MGTFKLPNNPGPGEAVHEGLLRLPWQDSWYHPPGQGKTR